MRNLDFRCLLKSSSDAIIVRVNHASPCVVAVLYKINRELSIITFIN